MKKIFIFSMSFLILMISFQQGLILIHFKLNQKSIEEKFCINKNKPELQCHGCCHLKKELEQNSDSSNIKNLGLYKYVDFIPLSKNFTEIRKCIVQNTNAIFFYRENRRPQNFIKKNLKPPILYI